MSYNAGDLCCIHHGSGSSKSVKVWTYYTTDNLASNTAGAAATNYFQDAYGDNPNIATGDIIMAVNGATPVVSMFVVSAANDNGVSVVGSSGMQAQLKT